jgi:hypothetical protein
MESLSDRRTHVNHSFDQFRFLEFRHGRVSTFEFGARQALAVL